MLARELLRAVRQIVSQVELVGMDVVEVSPPYDHAEITAILAHRTRHGSDQRARRQAAMSAAFDGEIADNRTLWDAWTAIHTTGDFYDVQRFRDDPDRRADRALGAGGGRRHRGQAPAPPAMPFRAGHAVVGPPRRRTRHRASTSASRRSRSRPSSRPRPALPTARGSSCPTSTTCPARWRARRSTSSTPAAACSAGCPSSSRGLEPWPRSCGRAASSTSTRDIP